MGRNAKLKRERRQNPTPQQKQQFPTLNDEAVFQRDLERWKKDRSLILADVLAIAQADPQMGLVYGREWTAEEVQGAVASVERMLDGGLVQEQAGCSFPPTFINSKEKA